MFRLKASLLAISFFILVLSGCSPQESVEPVMCFKSSATIRLEDITIKADVEHTQAGEISATVRAPKELDGLQYRYTNSTLYIEYTGLKCITCADYLPSDNPFQILFDILLSMKSNELSPDISNDEFTVFVGVSGNGRYRVFVSNKTGQILKLAPSYIDCIIEFHNSP